VTELKNDEAPLGETPVPIERAARQIGTSTPWLRARARAGLVETIQLSGECLRPAEKLGAELQGLEAGQGRPLAAGSGGEGLRPSGLAARAS